MSYANKLRYFKDTMIKRIASSKLIRATGIYTGTNLINSAIPFFLLPVMTRFLTPSDYGTLAMFQVLLGIAGIFTGLSVHGAIARQYFEKGTIDFPKYVANCLYILCISSTVVTLFMLTCSAWISRFTKFPIDWIWIVPVVSAGQFVINIVLVIWQVREKSMAYGTFQILLTIVNVALSLWFIIGFNMGWQGRVQGQSIAIIVFALTGYLLLQRNACLKWKYDSSYIYHALKFGIPLIPHSLGMLLISVTDRLMIANMVSVADAGIYVVGVQMGMIILIIQDSFNQAWVPQFFKKLKENNKEQDIKIVKVTYLYNIVILLCAILFAYVAPQILDIFVGKDFKSASIYLLWIALGYAFNGMYKMVSGYLIYLQKTHILAAITFITAMLHIVFSYILISYNGAVGAAQGTMLAYLVSFLLTWIVSARMYQMPWSLRCR
jgi:O-antigen/teichoic acid export membrane protein